MTAHDGLLTEVAKYADQLAQSETLADRGSMRAADVLADLYAERLWVAEWETVKPVRPDAIGRPTQPDSRNRFSQWLAWRLEQDGHHPLVSRRTYQLLNAHDMASYLNRVQITSERVIRPLDWLRRYRHAERVPEIFKRAVELAGSEDAVTSAHTRQALNEWKRANQGGVRVAIAADKAHRDRIKAQAAVETLMRDGNIREIAAFNDWVAERLDQAFAGAPHER